MLPDRTETAEPAEPVAGRPIPRTGWRDAVLLIVAGGLCALAQPPLHLLPLLFVGFGLLFLRLEAIDRLVPALAAGWLFGIGYFSAGLYWLGLPVVIDVPGDFDRDLLLVAGLVGFPAAAIAAGALGARLAGRRRIGRRWVGAVAAALVLALWIALAVAFLPGRFTWMIPFNVFGLGAVLAATTAVATGIAWRAAPGGGVRRVLALAAAWAALEWVRGVILTGFPWNLAATVWAEFPGAAQSLAWWGPFGLSLVTVALAALPAALIGKAARNRRTLAWTGGLTAATAAVLVTGFFTIPAAVEAVPGVRLRIVQGAVAQSLKWRPGARRPILLRYAALTRSDGFDGITHVVWPETALPYRLQTRHAVVAVEGDIRRLLLAAVPDRGVLITGANRDAGPDTWNSIHVVDKSGKPVSTYDKHHLVPFGEFVPARAFLGRIGVTKIAHGRRDYAFGPGPRSIAVPGAPDASPLICYEAIFPAEAVGATRPGWLLNLTNDAWFGNSAGPYQHFAAARLRTIEQGLPMVRAANTGISAVVDPWGRVTGLLPLGARGVLDADLPRARPPTLYARYGDFVFLLLLLAVAALARLAPCRPTPEPHPPSDP